jgi:hypothetical protein
VKRYWHTFILSNNYINITMGTQLTAKRAGTCPECKKSWKIGDQAYWDSSVKNSAGFSVMCIDADCFKEQGGKETPKSGGFTGGFKKGFSKPQVDVTLKVPEIEVSDSVRTDAQTLKQYIRQADELVEELYNLPAGDQTRGQIRSKFVDQLIAIGKSN